MKPKLIEPAMFSRAWSFVLMTVGLGMGVALSGRAALDPDPPHIQTLTRTNNEVVLHWAPYPAAQAYRIYSAKTPAEAWAEVLEGSMGVGEWSGVAGGESGFYRLEVEPLPDEELLAANVLNRLAYGPTPDEWTRLLAGASPLGARGYIREQLAMESIADDLDTQPVNQGWQYVTFTGTAGAGRLYLYLNGAGTVFIDDIKLVKGSEAEVGANLLVNGGFESPLVPANWQVTANFSNSVSSAEAAHSGSSSLKLVATAAGSGGGNSVFQNFSGFSSGQIYTFSYWYLPTETSARLTVRFSGNTDVPAVVLRPTAPPISETYSKLKAETATLADLRSWLVLRAVDSPRQLLEVMTQFWENHFVTEHSKTIDFFDRFYDDGTQLDRIATELEFREISKWRALLSKPQATFHEFLKVSAESPAQIIYLDTVGSRGDGRNIANENYSRELLELYTFGVDNGYDQNDITVMSRAWSGWSVRLVDANQVGNPFALTTTNRLDNTITNATGGATSNLLGRWSFIFRPERHNTNSKTLFPARTVPDRFGAPWAGRPYELVLRAQSGTNAITEGYRILEHLADQPFTQEFISVKLCRLFVHDEFLHGFYDFSKPDELSEEGKLVLACMKAWENGTPKGQIRDVLKTIFDSELFQKHGSSMQKVKTPLEFCVSAIRALRGSLGNGKYGATTDGYSIVGRSRTASSSPLVRMGVMRLFDRAEPDGYAESAPAWISAGTLAERLRFIQSFLMANGDSGKNDGISGGNLNQSDPVGLLKVHLPAAQWTQPEPVVDYFLSILFHAEGAGNLVEYRNAALTFLNTAEDGVTSSPFQALSPGTPAYDTRVRGMVSVLMTSPRFQEQ